MSAWDAGTHSLKTSSAPAGSAVKHSLNPSTPVRLGDSERVVGLHPNKAMGMTFAGMSDSLVVTLRGSAVR
jgi:hypothetical protein